MLMLLYVNSAVPFPNLREALQTCQHIRSATNPYCFFGHLLGTNRRLTHLMLKGLTPSFASAPKQKVTLLQSVALVCIPVFFAGTDMKYW